MDEKQTKLRLRELRSSFGVLSHFFERYEAAPTAVRLKAIRIEVEILEALVKQLKESIS